MNRMDKQRSDDEQGLGPMQGTLGQRLIVFFLVVGVGVLFGMGGSVALLQEGRAQAEIGKGITTSELRQHVRLFIQTTELVRGQPVPQQDQMMNYIQSMMLNQLQMARLGEAEGLMPRGEARLELLREFLQQDLMYDPGRTVADAVSDRAGSEQEIDLDQLADYLATEQAAQAFQARYIPTPAVTPAMGALLAHKQRNKVTVDQVVLSGERFMSELQAEVAEDEEALQDAYDDLMFERFAIPASVRVLAVVADAGAIEPHLSIDPTVVQERYEAVKEERFRIASPAETEVDEAEQEAEEAEQEAEEARYRPLAEVRDLLLAELKDERASALAEQLIKAVDAELAKKGLTERQADQAEIRQTIDAVVLRAGAEGLEDLQQDIAPQVHEQVRVTRPAGRQALLTLEDGAGRQLARIDDAPFYDKEEGFVSLPMQADDQPGLHLLVRLQERVPESHQDLEEVREEVIRYLAGQRAYARLREAAEALRQDADAAGGLRAHARPEVLDPWDTELVEKRLEPLRELLPPPEEAGGTILGEPMVALDLAARPRPVVLVQEDWVEDVPRMRVLQAVRLERVTTGAEEENRLARQYRGYLQNYLRSLFEERLEAEQG